jgi:hypothetical protein
MRKLLVLLSAIAFVVAFTVTAMAADWGFYGSARMCTFMEDYSKEATAAGLFDDSDLAWSSLGSSRFGANAKAGDIGGKFEAGFDSGTSNTTLRQIFGTWNFGAGELLVGQGYTPSFYVISNQTTTADISGLKMGSPYGGRLPMVQLQVGGLKIAAIKTNTGNVVTAATDTDTSMPKLEVSYDLKAGPVALHIWGGYNSYTEAVTTTDKEYDVDSTLYGVAFKFAPGPFYVNGSVYMGTNNGSYGLLGYETMGAAYNSTADSIEDADNLAYLLVAGFKVSDMITLEAGYGVLENEKTVAGTKTEDTFNGYYIQAPITLAKGMTIIPEYGKFDYDEVKVGTTTTKQGDMSYFGAKWQIDF